MDREKGDITVTENSVDSDITVTDDFADIVVGDLIENRVTGQHGTVTEVKVEKDHRICKVKYARDDLVWSLSRELRKSNAWNFTKYKFFRWSREFIFVIFNENALLKVIVRLGILLVAYVGGVLAVDTTSLPAALSILLG